MVRFHTGVGFLGGCPSVETGFEVELDEEDGETVVVGFGGDEEASEVVMLLAEAGVAVDLVLEISRFEGKDCLIGLFDSELGSEMNLGGLCRLFGGDEDVI